MCIEQNSLNYTPQGFALSLYISYATIFRNLSIIKANQTWTGRRREEVCSSLRDPGCCLIKQLIPCIIVRLGKRNQDEQASQHEGILGQEHPQFNVQAIQPSYSFVIKNQQQYNLTSIHLYLSIFSYHLVL